MGEWIAYKLMVITYKTRSTAGTQANYISHLIREKAIYQHANYDHLTNCYSQYLRAIYSASVVGESFQR